MGIAAIRRRWTSSERVCISELYASVEAEASSSAARSFSQSSTMRPALPAASSMRPLGLSSTMIYLQMIQTFAARLLTPAGKSLESRKFLRR